MRKKILLWAIISFVIDRFTKFLVIFFLPLHKSYPIIPNLFSFTYVQNKGAAWGILDGNILLLIAITITALFFLFRFIFSEISYSHLDQMTYGLLLGGIFGNLIDRVMYQYVIDFIDVTIFGYHFPVFNLADSCIVISVILMIISALGGGKNEDHSR